MKNKNIQVSIIVVNYEVEKELINCITSIINSKPKVSYEIIVVDNDETNTLRRVLKEFLQVKYIKSSGNIGFGAGNNVGVKSSSGEFLFFLNPDTAITKNTIDVLYNFIKENPNAGMIAPLLLSPEKNIYPNQGSDNYNLASAIVVNSFINKIFPNNAISAKFFHRAWNKKDVEAFDVVPGTAFMVRKSVFEKVGKFDEKFFLYFEEYDLAKRIKKLGLRNYIIPKAKISHIWEASTKKRKDIGKIFSESQYLFFKKYHGVLFASIINFVSSIGKYELTFGLIIALSAFLGFFRINELMPFIGDQGWFYLSARDMLVDGRVPIVGIASSHPWLHQGPLWTYLLAPFLWLFNFSPVSGAYLTIILGILSVIGIYVIGATLFSKRVGLIASLLYATSPLAIYYMRFPYHTSPIPLLAMVLVFSLYKIAQNKMIYLSLTVFSLAVLYNFEISTALLWAVVVGILGYKLLKKKISFKDIFNRKILIVSAIALTIPLLPMILYDVSNGFPQTLKFIAWIFYRALSLFGYNPQHEFSMDKITVMFNFLFNNFTKLVFAQSTLISQVFLICTIAWVIYFIFQKRKRSNSHNLVFLLFFIPLLLIILNQTPSDAYLLILVPVAILIFSLFLNFLMSIRKMKITIFIFIIVVVFSNISFMFKNDFAFDRSSRMFTLDKRLEAAYQILNIAGNKDYNLKGKGPGSEHESFTMNYEYLTWWLGHAPLRNDQSLKIYISESEAGVKIEKLNNK